jgi:hypothetical protein
MILSGLIDFSRYGLMGMGSSLMLIVFNAGPRVCAQSFPVSPAVTFATAVMALQISAIGFEKLFSANLPN